MQRLNQYRLVGWAIFGRNRKAKHYSVTLCETDVTTEADTDALIELSRKAIAADKVRTDGTLAVMRYDVERRDDGIDIVSGFGRVPALTVTP
jgi:hypothetical protein